MEYGILTFIPPIVVIVFAVVSRRTFPALLLGTVLCYIIMDGPGFFSPFVSGMYTVLMDGDTVWVIVLTALIGVFIRVVSSSGGVDALSQYMLKICTTRKKTMVSSWLMGMCFFIGDVSTIGTLTVTFKRVADLNKVPREALAYILDSTSAPVAVFVPISTWGVFFAGVFMAEPSLGFSGDPVAMYLKVMPFMFYPMAAVLVVGLFVLGIIPKLGAMKKAFERADTTGMVYSERSKEYNLGEDTEVKQVQGWKVSFFVIPLAILVFMAIKGSFLEGLMVSIVVALIMYLTTRAMTFKEFAQQSTSGVIDMLSPIFIIIGAFMIRDALVTMDMPNYVSYLLEPFLNVQVYPALVFLSVCLLSFTTGSNWGVPAVMVPILVPLGLSLGSNPFILLAAIASAGSFGSHACFYSDSTVFTSAVSKIDNMEHALTQIPYAVTSATLAFLSFLVAGFIVN